MGPVPIPVQFLVPCCSIPLECIGPGIGSRHVNKMHSLPLLLSSNYRAEIGLRVHKLQIFNVVFQPLLVWVLFTVAMKKKLLV